ncbi:hypothetical protein ACFU1R_29565 [Priestia megaterium]|uniref:hypothetical protein n=1 Tax=Priestia megaterium TaxID=1404 RepID=UPI0036701AE8
MLDKLFDIIINETHDKLTDFILRITNTLIQLFLGLLIIVYSFQSYIKWAKEDVILNNTLYLKYVEKYINMANDFATIGVKIAFSLFPFAVILFFVSYIVWLVFEFLRKKFKVELFFVGNLLVFISIALAFWSVVFWIVLSAAAYYPKYYILALPLEIFVYSMIIKWLKKFDHFLKKREQNNLSVNDKSQDR